jgi:hypothetical protein
MTLQKGISLRFSFADEIVIKKHSNTEEVNQSYGRVFPLAVCSALLSYFSAKTCEKEDRLNRQYHGKQFRVECPLQFRSSRSDAAPKTLLLAVPRLFL